MARDMISFVENRKKIVDEKNKHFMKIRACHIPFLNIYEYIYVLQLASMWSLHFGGKSITPVNEIKFRKLCKLKDVWSF